MSENKQNLGAAVGEDNKVDPIKLATRCLEMIADVGKQHSKLVDRVAKLEARVTNVQAKIKNTQQGDNEKETAKFELPQVSVPDGIRKSVDDLLGPAVGIRVEPSKDNPSFTIHLTIPKELSNEIAQPDVRSRNFSYSQGLPGVQEWLQKVRKNIFVTAQRKGEPVKLP